MSKIYEIKINDKPFTIKDLHEIYTEARVNGKFIPAIITHIVNLTSLVLTDEVLLINIEEINCIATFIHECGEPINNIKAVPHKTTLPNYVRR